MPFTTIAHVDEVDQTHATVDDLHAAGFPTSSISVVAPDSAHSAVDRTESPTGPAQRTFQNSSRYAPTRGLVTRSLPSVDLRPVPGFVRLLATGPILTILSGLGLRAAPDGMVRSLTGMGLSNEKALYFSSRFDAGQVLVVIRTDEESSSELVANILRQHHSHDITHAQWPVKIHHEIDPA